MYTNEQFEKHQAYVEKEMADCTFDQRSDIIRDLRYKWPTDDELKEAVTKKKAQIAKEASPKDMEEIFKYLGI